MKRSFALFSAVCLLAWTLPLGAFIKPSQEKMACGGNRAFHMCSMMSGGEQAPTKAVKNSDGKISFSDASGAARTAKASAAGGGMDWLLVAVLSLPDLDKSLFKHKQPLSYSSPLNSPAAQPPELFLSF